MSHRDHTQDRQLANNEVVATDVTNVLQQVLPVFFPKTISHETSFEGRKLNDMVDLVEHANPSALAHAGEALWSARDAISDAAEELHGHISAVDWHGESGSKFRAWGESLVSNTRALSKYAGDAGTQITVAGSGLSSVQKSMPPKDTRAHPKTVEEIPAHKRVKGDPDYDAAVAVEGHRQEAINQMTRLASFYSVAGTTLASQSPPTFDPMPEVGVPKPAPGWSPDGPASDTGHTRLETVSRHVDHATGHVTGDGGGRHDLPAHRTITDQLPHRPGTELDSIAPSRTQTPLPLEPRPTPHSNPPGPITNPLGPNTNPPLSFPNRNVNTSGNKFPNPLGKSTASQAGGTKREVISGKGKGNSGTTGSGRQPMGRAVTGGTPRTVGQAKSSQAGATRKGGVVGGRPSSQASGSSSRVPRGTVIGGKQQSGGRGQRTAGRIGQRGVIGAPKEQTKGPKGERAGFTSGGSGLVRDNGDEHHIPHHDTQNNDQAEGWYHQETDNVVPPEHQHRLPHAPPATD